MSTQPDLEQQFEDLLDQLVAGEVSENDPRFEDFGSRVSGFESRLEAARQAREALLGWAGEGKLDLSQALSAATTADRASVEQTLRGLAGEKEPETPGSWNWIGWAAALLLGIGGLYVRSPWSDASSSPAATGLLGESLLPIEFIHTPEGPQASWSEVEGTRRYHLELSIRRPGNGWELVLDSESSVPGWKLADPQYASLEMELLIEALDEFGVPLDVQRVQLQP